MVPCELTSKGPEAALRLKRADEDPQVNPALEYYLREKHKLHLPSVPEDPVTSSLRDFLRSVGNIVAEVRWTVAEEVWLSTFSFECW
jgi:hypothetical protein